MNSKKIIALVLVVIATLIEVTADIYFKKWSQDGKISLIAIGLFLYLVGSGFWAYSLKFDSLSKIGTIFTVLNLALIILSGVFLFKESLSPINKIGIGFGLIAIILMEM